MPRNANLTLAIMKLVERIDIKLEVLNFERQQLLAMQAEERRTPKPVKVATPAAATTTKAS
jgi:hypothetical protein